ncbi:TonB-dependent receptor [Pseudocolwellia agarivorans]|uniref:TonB-dependent receptor n=1 Tax=Pseudocolwellia agarivorans TaxID=1911682 RepID=UPI0009841EBD|nr:TonB-dependent receptor [Pseudocolwellia agarivorans]
MINHTPLFKKSAVFLALSSTFVMPCYVIAEEADNAEMRGIERIQVTASRRTSSVQEAPLNITALDSDVMKDQNIGKLTEIARWVPGLSIPDQGGRGGNNIIVRGLSTNSTGPDSDGGTVATYFGEMPLGVDVRLIDVERVEVLIGPQGTLYGAGTLGGALRYIPKKAELDVTSIELSGDIFNGAESDNLGGETSFVINKPLIEDVLAVRASFNYYNDPGFIDYAYTIKEGGVSNPDPDWNNQQEVNDNIRSVKDANGEEVLTTRIALRWTPTDWLDGTLTYLYQKSDVEGRTVSNYKTLGAGNPLRDLVGKYESAERYLEPDENKDSLISLELTADLGFAELVSATGFSEHKNKGQRDQTDLLIANDWSYETFPTFSAFTRETEDYDNFTQEVRLVSQSDSMFSWIVGAYYNKDSGEALSEEYTPHYADFAGSNRADDLEYLQYTDEDVVEKALFGEMSFQFTEKFNVTLGARFYKYDIDTTSAFTLGLWDWERDLIGDSLVFDPEAIDDDGNKVLINTLSDGDGSLFKLNASYKFTPDIILYATASEGFRLGGTNGIAACPEKLVAGQQYVCAEPEEFAYKPDSTTNYELGFKSTWFDNKLHFNATLFNIDWEDAQVGGAATENGGLPYIANAGTANSKGIEISSRAMLSDSLTVFMSYAHAKAKLTEDVVGFFGRLEAGDPATDEYSILSGDRLPGAPEHQFSFGVNYSQEVFDNKMLDIVYGITAQSDIYSSAGLRAEGESLPGYALSNLSATLSDDQWSVTLYVDNLFNKYAYSSTRSTGKFAGYYEFSNTYQDGDIINGVEVEDVAKVIDNEATFDQYRAYSHYVVAPRTIGIKVNYLFDL